MSSLSSLKYSILLHPALVDERGTIIRDAKGLPKTRREGKCTDSIVEYATVDREAGILAFPMHDPNEGGEHCFFVDLPLLDGPTSQVPVHRALRDEDGEIVRDGKKRPHPRSLAGGKQPYATLNREAGVLEIPTGHISCFWRDEYGPAPETYFIHLGNLRRPYTQHLTHVLERPLWAPERKKPVSADPRG
ncbi:MAG: hypothetical protein HY053_07675 [Proteobacteria bacterium]|nr:hypothetical protein [Pseudomonadota bacterium]